MEMTNSRFHIQTEHFHGPFDLLLSLIEKRKLHINDVSLTQVADDFIAYVNSHDDFPVEETAHFIVVAATLLLIKSRSLLPELDLTQEEEEDVEDLERRLRLYKKIRRIALLLHPQWLKTPMVSRLATPRPKTVFAPGKLSTDTLHHTLATLLKQTQQTVQTLPEVKVQKVMSLDAMIDRLSRRIERSLTMSFKEFSGLGKEEKVHVVVSFLAMLELVKQGSLRVQQSGAFQDIQLETTQSTDTPRYD